MQKTAGEFVVSQFAGRLIHSSALLLVLAFLADSTLTGQPVPSGSTGVDGDLILNTPGITIFTTRPAGGGSVYNFNTIQIGAGSTLKLSGAVFTGPLYFLAQGAVTIAGTIDLNGQNGALPVTTVDRIGPTIPGAGGFGGGSAAFNGNPAQPGLGPDFGKLVCDFYGGRNGSNQFLVPLIGGSGGTGEAWSGGAGGGALLIASSVSIALPGTITANGGTSATVSYGGSGGGGAGGSVRLVAPVIAGSGTISASGGDGSGFCNPHGSTNQAGGSGIVRFEAFQNSFSGSLLGTVYKATPFNLFVPSTTALPALVVTSIGGVPVPPNPTGGFVVPDVLLNSSSLVVNIRATNIPAGTTATLYFLTENFPDQQVVSTPLVATSTPGATTATATVTLNPGFSRGYAIATWVQ